MGDAYWRYAAERGGLPPAGGLDLAGIQTSRDYPGYLPRESSQPTGRDFPGFLPREISQPVGRDIPGYLPRENPQLNDRIAHSMLRTHDPLGAPSETLRNGISPYGAGGLTASEISSLGGGSGIGVGGLSGGVGPGGGSRIGLGGVAAGAGLLGPAPLNDPVLMGQRQGGVGIDPALARLPDSAISGSTFRLPDHLKPDESSNTIFIEGLPADCSRREVAQWKDFPKGPRVLVLDEDSEAAAETNSRLEGFEYVVSTFSNETEALAVLANETNSFHVALVEVTTGNSCVGFRFLQTACDIPTIMMSNRSCLSMTMKCIAVGGEPYVLCFVEFIDAKCALTAISSLKECLWNIWHPSSMHDKLDSMLLSC